MKKKLFYIAPPLMVAAGFIIMMILFSFKTENPKKTPEVKGRAVEVEIVKLEDNLSVIEAFGRLVSNSPLLLISEVEGTLQEGQVPFQPGVSFSRGDTLLKVDARQVQLDINSTKSDFMNALALVLPEIKLDFPLKFDTWQKY